MKRFLVGIFSLFLILSFTVSVAAQNKEESVGIQKTIELKEKTEAVKKELEKFTETFYSVKSGMANLELAAKSLGFWLALGQKELRHVEVNKTDSRIIKSLVTKLDEVVKTLLRKAEFYNARLEEIRDQRDEINNILDEPGDFSESELDRMSGKIKESGDLLEKIKALLEETQATDVVDAWQFTEEIEMYVDSPEDRGRKQFFILVGGYTRGHGEDSDDAYSLGTMYSTKNLKFFTEANITFYSQTEFALTFNWMLFRWYNFRNLWDPDDRAYLVGLFLGFGGCNIKAENSYKNFAAHVGAKLMYGHWYLETKLNLFPNERNPYFTIHPSFSLGLWF